MDAAFRIDGGRLIPTEGSIGPWGDLVQGSPAAAAMVHAIDRLGLDAGWLPGRMSFDLWRPIARRPIDLRARLLRDGKKAKTIETALVIDDVEVARCTAVMLRTIDTAVPAPNETPPPSPEEGKPVPPEVRAWSPFFAGVETRAIKGALEAPGPAAAWFRLTRPMIQGVADTPAMRAVSAADLTSGISAVVDLRKWSFVNPELTVHLHRLPEGDWVLNDAATTLDRNGTGLATGVLSDRKGAFGRASMSLIVEPR